MTFDLAGSPSLNGWTRSLRGSWEFLSLVWYCSNVHVHVYLHVYLYYMCVHCTCVYIVLYVHVHVYTYTCTCACLLEFPPPPLSPSPSLPPSLSLSLSLSPLPLSPSPLTGMQDTLVQYRQFSDTSLTLPSYGRALKRLESFMPFEEELVSWVVTWQSCDSHMTIT